MNKISFDNFFKVLCLKNQLLSLDEMTLSDIYLNDKDSMVDITINSLKYLIDNEEEFFYLHNSLINKALYIIGDIKVANKEYINDINYIIVKLNEFKTLNTDIKVEKIVEYIEKQSEYRKTYLELETLINSINYDALVVYYLLGNNFIEYDDKDLILASLNYLISLYPEFFKKEEINDMVVFLFNELKRKIGLNLNLRAYLNETKKEYKKMVG